MMVTKPKLVLAAAFLSATMATGLAKQLPSMMRLICDEPAATGSLPPPAPAGLKLNSGEEAAAYDRLGRMFFAVPRRS
jgi:hypothetical protein